MENMFKKDMADKLKGLDEFKVQVEKSHSTGDDEYKDIRHELNYLNAEDNLDKSERIQLVKANIMFEMLRSIDQVNESIQELN
ncbi:hypothetical protein [Weissella fangxianensis]|uniref:hypothetical protein n=1 Tax=Weissella fangxianensis TaxID=2953879 RepID=UPI002157E7F9|nr:hypothetical protein [Weissella fangxianensis]